MQLLEIISLLCTRKARENLLELGMDLRPTVSQWIALSTKGGVMLSSLFTYTSNLNGRQ